MTDKGSHFTAQIVESLEKQLPFNHVYSIVYAPWTNGAAEVANRNVLRVIRSLCLQYVIDSAHWQNLLPLIQSFINNKPMTERAT